MQHWHAVFTRAYVCSCARQFQNLHEGNVSSLEGTHSGRLLFTGGADGLLMAHDLRMKEASRVLWHHNASVNGLALEDPWLVSAASGVCVCVDRGRTCEYIPRQLCDVVLCREHAWCESTVQDSIVVCKGGEQVGRGSGGRQGAVTPQR